VNDDFRPAAPWTGLQPSEPAAPVPATAPAAILRLRAELRAARDGISSITRFTLPHRDRVVASIRAGLPDVAGRAAHEVGPETTIAEIRRFAGLGSAHEDDACPVVQLWGEILGLAEEAAVAAS
jgi:hypothetical protein